MPSEAHHDDGARPRADGKSVTDATVNIAFGDNATHLIASLMAEDTSADAIYATCGPTPLTRRGPFATTSSGE